MISYYNVANVRLVIFILILLENLNQHQNVLDCSGKTAVPCETLTRGLWYLEMVIGMGKYTIFLATGE